MYNIKVSDPCVETKRAFLCIKNITNAETWT